MLFALIRNDKPGHLAVRQENRPAHVEFLNGLGDALKGAGPLLDDDGNPCGSLILLDADSKEAAAEITKLDPYEKAGLFQSTEIRPWAWLIKNPEGA